MLKDIKEVQTLSRLNRAHQEKYDTFVLDFANDTETIKEAFDTYYKTTVLSQETDPNKLYDLISTMEIYQVYTDYHVQTIVELYLNGADRDKLDPILDTCVNLYKELDEDSQVAFMGSAKGFVRSYGFLSAILPFGDVVWEKLSIFLNLLIPKLPSPKNEDLSKGILETIDLDSYRAEMQVTVSILLEDTDSEIEPVPSGSPISTKEPEMDLLSNILSMFHDLLGTNEWNYDDKVKKDIIEIFPIVANDSAYRTQRKITINKMQKLNAIKPLELQC